ncbi:sensor histidine kinase [Acutalibacter caecimuris]|uniref:sensor histidine kinase n=1 Tax=Acutalibacter caecimuris TaxID=3093657 RepID=UPI002AC8C439|nr:HAMP domain-containing sensor histidine kinase [Acutalibacter sp. M00118]
MLPALLLAVLALVLALFRLYAYRRQFLEMAQVLEKTPAESNLNLTVQTGGKPARQLCRAMNGRLEESRKLRLETIRREEALKYTMACISHDIRTPLAGAMGYLQLLEEEPERRVEYMEIIGKRLKELDGLLDELFLYTRLQSGPLPLDCGMVALLPPLYDALAEFYPKLEIAQIEPQLRFDREDITVYADRDALGRVYKNLISNAIRHGGGGLTVSATASGVCFANPIGAGERPDPTRLFDRLYQGDPARNHGGAGLGLAIVRELMEQMEGGVSARIEGNELQIELCFRNETE